MELKFVEPVFKNGKELVLVNEKDIASEVKRWENAVAAYFVGHDSTQNPPCFDKFLDDLFVSEWKKYGRVKVYSQGSGVFLLDFETLQGKGLALGEAPRFYCVSRPLILKPWSSDLSLEIKDLKSAPVWIRLPNLRLHLWSPEALSKIASMVGKPLFVDSTTASRKTLCYARICVEVELGKVLPDSVTIEDDKGHGYCQKVEYEWKPAPSPSRCSHYLHIGHSDSCPKRKSKCSPCLWCNESEPLKVCYKQSGPGKSVFPAFGAPPSNSPSLFRASNTPQLVASSTPLFGSISASPFSSNWSSVTATAPEPFGAKTSALFGANSEPTGASTVTSSTGPVSAFETT